MIVQFTIKSCILEQEIIKNHNMLSIGDKLPAFNLLDQDGNNFDSATLLGSPAVVYFYPKASTPGCTSEACDIRDNYNRFLALGYKVVGISKDSVAAIKKFAVNYNLPFPLLSDPSTEVLQAIGAWGEKKNYGKTYFGTIRKTYIFDAEGTLKEIISKVDTKNHTAQILK